ncbi:hypothetical protein H1R20_g146, partial [Candolleomyces eurysporus]
MSESSSAPNLTIKRMSNLFRKKDKEGPTSPIATSPSSAARTAQAEQATDAKAEADALKAFDEFKTQACFAAVLDLVRNKGSIDDRKLFLEHALTFVSRMDEGPMSQAIRDKIIQLFYNDLAHPAATSISPKFAWRTADGSYNNIDLPEMGKAGTPYSRSVQQTHALPANKLPDPGLLFDTVFRTSHRDENINETSSYVDLAILYGNNEDDQNRVRVRDGYGTLYPDCFAEDRILLFPPAVCTILVLFNRNHNYIAAKLLEINERGNWVDPKTLSPDDPKARAKLIQQDEEIFQTARLCNIGWFGTVVFSDYFSCILGREDEAHTEQVFNNLFPGKAVDEVTPMDFKIAAYNIQSNRPPTNEWTFGVLKRQEDGSFADGDLANILHNATEHPAGAFRARGTPPVMRLNEIMGIEQSRKWGVCSLNEFRKYLGLKTFTSFLEWNSDPEIARVAELLYGDINNLELYVGLQAEEAKPLVDGAGLCPGYTISRAILSDAISLTRGDRHFTHDFTPSNLTAWGFHDCQRDPGAFGFGSTLGRLFLRTLPDHFSENSIYAFFPLMTPDSMKVHLEKMNLLDKYDVSRPKTRSPPAVVDSQEAVVAILKDPSAFPAPYAEKVARIIQGKGFYPTGDKSEQKIVTDALGGSPALVDKIGEFFYSTAKKLIDQNTYTFVGGKTKGVDVVREVLRIAPIIWLANLTGIELKTSKEGEGDYTHEEFFEVLSDIYAFVFLNVEPSKVMVLQEKIKKNMPKLIDRITDNLGLFSGTKASVSGLMSTLFKHKKPDHEEIIHRLTENAIYKDRYVLANTLLAILVVANAELSLSLTNAVDLFLDKTKELQPLAASKDVSKLRGYVYEALRLVPPFAGVYRVSSSDQSVSGYSFKKGDRVFLDIFKANQKKGPDVAHPAKDLLRAEGAFDYLGEPLTVEILAQVLRAVFEKDGLVRAPGHSGVLQKFKDDSRPECHYAYLNHGHSICEWPTSLSVLVSTFQSKFEVELD